MENYEVLPIFTLCGIFFVSGHMLYAQVSRAKHYFNYFLNNGVREYLIFLYPCIFTATLFHGFRK